MSGAGESSQHPHPVYETRFRVRYAETDQLGVVYHANYIVWFEVGRVEMLRQMGFSYREMEKDDDTHIVVVDARCRYKMPARYDDYRVSHFPAERARIAAALRIRSLSR